MKRILLLAAIILSALGLKAQIITSNPPIITQSSTDIVLTYHADAEGSNQALVGLPSSTEVYAHIGVITNASSGTSDWKHAPTWGDNSAKYKCTYVSSGTYTLTIGTLKDYFGLTDGETVSKIAIVFRTADKTKEGKTSSGGDIFVDVYPDGYNMSFTSSISDGIASVGSSTTLTVGTTEKSTIVLKVNDKQLSQATDATSLTYTYKIEALGTYNFTATATNASGQSITKTISIVAPEASKAANYPGGVPQMGAVANADGSVTFCLAAPNKKSVILVPSWDNYVVKNENVMAYQDYNGYRYFWITVKGLDPDAVYKYYYLVDGSIKVADPYAHLVLDCYSDKYLDSSVWPNCPSYPYDKLDGVMLAVYRGNMDTEFKFSDFTIPDHHNLVIYEMLFRDFTGTDGKSEGNGTVQQAIAKLPYLVDLGVNAIELMPIMEFNGNNSWGYNTNFYFAPDKAYGSPTDYKYFIEECHKHGIAVILDIVFNQSDGLHPWYQMYDINSNPFYNAEAPHAYSVLNDWNQDNPLVQQQWTDVIKYWMTVYNVDGFRFDLVKGLGDNNSYGSGTEAYNQSRIDRMKRLHAVIKSVKPNGIHINENLAGASEETEMANDGQLQWGNFNYGFTQYCIGQSSGINLHQLYRDYGRPNGSTIAYAESHDEERLGYSMQTSAPTAVKSIGNTCKRLGTAAVQLLLCPGPKMIWQFGELGANQTTKNSSGNNTDPKKVIWSNLDNTNYAGLHDVYRALCCLRLSNPELFSASATYIISNLNSAITSPRTIVLRSGDKEVVAFINSNTTGSAATVSTTSASYVNASNYQLICATLGTTPTLSGTSSISCSLAPNSMAVFASKNVSGVEDAFVDEDAPAFEVYGGIGEIVIVGEYSNATAYTLDGRSTSSLTNLTKGIYVVVVDGVSTKVVVK